MKKFAISLLALAAVSTVAFADQNRGDLRDSDTYFGKYSNQVKDQSTTSSNALAIPSEKAGALTAFERMQQTAEGNDNSGH